MATKTQAESCKKQRPSRSRSPPDISRALTDSVLTFSLHLYKQLQTENKQGENIFCSPFSIAVALSMALVGARNNTAEEISALLDVKGKKDKVHENFSKFLANLSSFAPHVVFHVANRIYSAEEYSVRKSYRSLLENSYGATIKSADFKNSHEAVRLEANAWVSEQTASKIQDLLAPGSVDATTAIILLNAIYFKGFWETPFEANNTRPQDFHLDSKKSVRIDMMYQERESYKLGHSKELKARALEMPYRGQKMSMILLLPDEVEGLCFLEKQLSPSRLSALFGSLKVDNSVQLTVPKFKLEHSIGLSNTLKALGIREMFTPGIADLSGIFEKGSPAVSDVVHKAFVEVDEEGTEAAAATGMTLMMCGAMVASHPTRFIVDHPFMFFIKTNEPEVVLFVGSVRKL
ncbi:hypothetical protein V5799_007216 [Amblyomma americanum]|uniref:Serpin domain-containing protein n=1 Tax=Amblyomma americanum TaxID=6943 RepID=A0AAQ4DU61_AMBAM